MCNYTGSHFGASYPDACCIDGFLWDLDSCDEPGGGLSQGGDRPCPECNTEQYLFGGDEDYLDLHAGRGFNVSGAMTWEAVVKYAAQVNRVSTVEAIKKHGPVEATDFICRVVKNWDDVRERVYLPEESLRLIDDR